MKFLNFSERAFGGKVHAKNTRNWPAQQPAPKTKKIAFDQQSNSKKKPMEERSANTQIQKVSKYFEQGKLPQACSPGLPEYNESLLYKL